MNRWMMWLAAGIMLAGAGIWTAGADEGMVLAEDGQAKAAIVVGAEAGATERFAAEELASILKQVTGAAFEIRTDRPKEGACVFVGQAGGRAVGQRAEDRGPRG